MHEVPECLTRRYEAVDELIQELSSKLQQITENDCPKDSDPGIKLMCDFWSILKENPNCDLPKLVQKRMCPESPSTQHNPIPDAKSSIFGRLQRIMCYMTNDTTRESSVSSGKPVNSNKKCSCPSKNTSSAGSNNTTNDLPLSKVLCNLKQAVSFDKRCASRINDLLETEKKLQGQIARLEDNERQGVVLLKQADCMWSCMENAYKEKIADSLERQKCLLQQLKDVEKSVNKWRKNKKDLESQLDNIAKAQLEINEKISRKTNDIKSLNVEIDGFKKRIEANKKVTEATKKSTEPKKKQANAKVERIMAEMKRLEALDENEKKAKLEKDAEGAAYIKEAREDLQKICKALLQKQLEREDLAGEKKSLIEEIDLLKTTCDLCKDKCKRKQESMGQELNKVEAELAVFKVKCIKCNQCTDTSDQRYYCNDCPRCAAHRECLVQGDTCSTDIKESCVCQMVKQKLLDNIFENMYTVLDRQVRSRPGKVIADQVLQSLKNSRNGKLNTGTKKVLQEFILTTIKKNLNLTIVGGAVKTRCELDPDTYNQLMLCLKQIKATRVPHSDKGTESNKGPCKRWGGSKDCYCPKGPKDCVCIKKAPPPRTGKGPCPPLPVDKEDAGEVMKCPNKKDAVCGLDCSMHTPERMTEDVSKWKPDPCGGPNCPYLKNMRAAQCVLGPEIIEPFDSKKKVVSRNSIPKLPGNAKKQVAQDWKNAIKSSKMQRNSASNLKVEKEITCKCGDMPMRFCSCRKDAKQLKLDGGCKCAIPRKCHSLEGVPCKVSVRKFYKIHEGHQKESASENTPFGKEIESRLDNKVTLKENEMENVEKEDEIVRLDYNSVKTTMKQVPEDRPNIKTDAPTGTVFQPVTETLTSEYKSTETSKNMKEAPDINKSQENFSLTDAPPTNVQATDNIVPYRSVDINKAINNTRTSYVEAKDEIQTSEYKSVEMNKVVMKKVPDINKPQGNNANIIDTPSGSIAMEIENTFLDKLEKKLIENPNVHVYLRELNSRQLIVDFKPQESVSNLKVHVTKSPTGEIQFVLFKNLSTSLRPCESCETVCEQDTDVESLILKVVRRECKLKGTPTDCRKVCNEATSSISNKRQALRKTAKMEREEIRNFIENVILNKIPKEAKIHKCRLTDKGSSIELDKKEVEIFYNNNRGEIKLNVQGENGAKASVGAHLRRTLSGNIVMDIKDINCVGVIADSSKECPVLVKKSSSGAYMLFIGHQKPEQKPNTILKRTESGRMLIVITEPILKSLILPKPPLQELAKEKLYKVSVKSASSRVTAIPAFLKMTSSGNYLLVLDKEFEKQFNNHIMNSMNDHNQCHIELQKTASDAIVINFDKQCNENMCYNKQNAVLVKTSSGHLRILVNGEKYNTLSQNLLKVNTNKSSKAFEELLRHIHTLSSPGYSQSKSITESSFIKQSSDSQFLDSVKSSNLTNFNRPIKIQKTPSGQYAVVLDKNSKMAFLTALKNYLNVNNKGHVPVRRTGSGDIMIFLDPEGQSTDLYGSLRISPSGNVYVIMDENVLKASSATPSGMTELGSHHIIKKVKHPRNKTADTNCSTDLDACLCNPSCICRDLLECVDKRRRSRDTKSCHFYKTKKILPCPSKCYASCCMKNRFNRINVAENPCECLNPSYIEQKNIQQCYCVHESFCTTNETLSNELLEASCSCRETDNSTSLSEILHDSVEESTLTSYESVENCKYDWSYLPLQLPPVLSNFRPFVAT